MNNYWNFEIYSNPTRHELGVYIDKKKNFLLGRTNFTLGEGVLAPGLMYGETYKGCPGDCEEYAKKYIWNYLIEVRNRLEDIRETTRSQISRTTSGRLNEYIPRIKTSLLIIEGLILKNKDKHYIILQ